MRVSLKRRFARVGAAFLLLVFLAGAVPLVNAQAAGAVNPAVGFYNMAYSLSGVTFDYFEEGFTGEYDGINDSYHTIVNQWTYNAAWMKTPGKEEYTYTINVPAGVNYPCRVHMAWTAYDVDTIIAEGTGSAKPLAPFYYYFQPLLLDFQSPLDAKTFTLSSTRDQSVFDPDTGTYKKVTTTKTSTHIIKIAESSSVKYTPAIKEIGVMYKGVKYPAVSSTYGKPQDDPAFVVQSHLPFETNEFKLDLTKIATYTELYKSAYIYFEANTQDPNVLLTTQNGTTIANAADKYFPFYSNSFVFYLGYPAQLNANRNKVSMWVETKPEKTTEPTPRLKLSASISGIGKWYSYASANKSTQWKYSRKGNTFTWNVTALTQATAETKYKIAFGTDWESYKPVAVYSGHNKKSGANLAKWSKKENAMVAKKSYRLDSAKKFTVKYQLKADPTKVFYKNVTVKATPKLSGDNSLYGLDFYQYGGSGKMKTQLISNYDSAGTKYLTYMLKTSSVKKLRVAAYTGYNATIGVVGKQSFQSPSLDFTKPVTFKVTAENGKSQTYVVTVKKGDSAAKLTVAGPATRKVTIDARKSATSYYSVEIANTGGKTLTGLSASLTGSGAGKFALDHYWTVGGKYNDTLKPADGDYDEITFSGEENTNIAEISIVPKPTTPSGKYSVTLNVKSANGGSQKVKLTITYKKGKYIQSWVDRVELNATDITLAQGQSFQLSATAIPTYVANPGFTYTSSAPGVASVNSAGLVTAKATGTAEIRVTSVASGEVAVCHVTVS